MTSKRLSVLLALGVALVYVFVPMWISGRAFVLPLDDVYIHFQYAKQIANGQPYVYNPGLPPSSGATSLIYPYLLAVGYAIGFTGLSLGWWALLLGTLSLVGSCWLVFQLGRVADLPPLYAGLVVTIFALTGSVSWHYVSGMETGLLIFFMLLTLYGIVTRRFALSIAAVALMAVTRPEGAIMAVIAACVMVLTYWRHGWRLVFVALPMLALGVQPLVNGVFTGNTQAAGSSAKSILSMVPADQNVIIGRIAANFGHMWWEFLTGYSVREGLYLPVGLLVLAVIGVLMKRRWDVALLVAGWLSAGTLAVATLDPAFWHFKRYQMPFMALLFPLAAWGIAWIIAHDERRVFSRVILGVLGASALWSAVTFWRSYQINVTYLTQQQLPMARWLSENTPPEAVIAVHDVGIMRYIGERTTVDMVGLTTPGAADSWRNGPGSLAEFMAAYQPRPDYVASYTDALGLSYLADTGLYGDLLADFPVNVSDRYNVALAGAYQGVWRVDWSAVEVADTPKQPYPLRVVDGLTQVDSIDVAHLPSEATHNYTWANDERLPGFPTEVYEFGYAACVDECRVLDGGRRINGFEQFTLETRPGQDVVLITRVHPAHAGTFDVYAGDVLQSTRTLPNIAGQWLEVATHIDGEYVNEQTQIRIEPQTPGGHYMPYYHWAYQGALPESSQSREVVATFGDSLTLTELATDIDDEQLTVTFAAQLDGSGRADYRVFVHVYDDVNAPPVAQVDRYPLDSATPPGNWLSGEVSDTFVVDLSNLTSGTYTIAVGFYDPVTGERLTPTGEEVLDGRLIVRDFEIE